MREREREVGGGGEGEGRGRGGEGEGEGEEEGEGEVERIKSILKHKLLKQFFGVKDVCVLLFYRKFPEFIVFIGTLISSFNPNSLDNKGSCLDFEGFFIVQEQCFIGSSG